MKYVEKIGGDEVVFPCLSLGEYEQIEQSARAARKAELVAYLNESKISGKERFEALATSRPDHVDPATVLSYIETLDGTRKVLRLSLAKSGKSDEQAGVVIERFEFADARNLATSLVRFTKRVRAGMKSAEEAEDPLP